MIFILKCESMHLENNQNVDFIFITNSIFYNFQKDKRQTKLVESQTYYDLIVLYKESV